ncbi:MAG: UbiA prenyltransferase family protein, partial [Candidatus Eisenbacteria bacterium]
MGNRISLILAEARPRQWVKNVVLFAGLVFSENVAEADLLIRAVAGFAAFCLLSGGLYIFNDIVDLESDKLHPDKRKRPLARGELGIVAASCGSGVFIGAGVCISVLLGGSFAAASALYLILGVLYSVYLKRLIILDALIISVGFVLRAIAGVEALRPTLASIEISPWLLVCTLFLALFMAF